MNEKRDTVRRPRRQRGDNEDGTSSKEDEDGVAAASGENAKEDPPLPVLKACACYFRETFRINIMALHLSKFSVML